MIPRYCLFKYNLLFCIITFGSVANLFAQKTITGKAIDALLNEPLVGVSVVQNNKGIVTNLSGDFTFNIAPNETTITLFFSYLGYQSKTITCGVDTPIIIYLTPTKNQLDEAVVTGSRSVGSLKRQTVSIDVIKPYLIENRVTTNLEQVMNQLPGVNVVDGQINIRSGSGWTYGAGSRVLVLVDDVPMITGDAGQVQWKFLPTENIGSIEVIKGASSVMYGSGSLNGIVNIRTATPTTKGKFSANVFSGFYSKPKRDSAQWFNGLQAYSGANAFYAKRYKQLDFTIGLNALNDNGYRLGEFDKRLRTNLKTNYRFKNTPALQVGLDGTLMTQQSASFLLWENFDYGYVALDSAQTKTKATIFSIDPHVDFVKSNYKIRYRGRFYGVDNNIEESSAGVDQDNNSINAYNELVGHYFLNKKRGTLALGTSNNYTLSKSPLYGGNNITANNIAVFTQTDLAYKKWSFNGGLRYEYFSMSNNLDDQLIGRLGFAFEATRTTFIRTSLGQGYRYPTIAERYIETSVGLVNIFPNPNLKPEKGYSAELGIKQGFAFGAFKGFIDAAYFFTEYDNMVEFNFGQWRAQPIDTNNFFNNVGFTSFNIGKARISGIDIGVTSGINTSKMEWLFMLGYTYSNPIMLAPNQVFATDSSAKKNQYTYNFTVTDSINNPLKYRYNHLAKIDAQFTYLKKYMIGLSVRYNSYMQNIDRVFVTAPINTASPGIDRGRLLNPNGDWVFDMRAGYTYKKVTLTTTINNVFNTEIMSRPADLRPTRLFILQLGYKF
jgi:iron complex outermembrane receptor protein